MKCLVKTVVEVEVKNYLYFNKFLDYFNIQNIFLILIDIYYVNIIYILINFLNYFNIKNIFFILINIYHVKIIYFLINFRLF